MWAVSEEQTGDNCSVCHLPLSIHEGVRLDPRACATGFHDEFVSLCGPLRVNPLKTCKFLLCCFSCN